MSPAVARTRFTSDAELLLTMTRTPERFSEPSEPCQRDDILSPEMFRGFPVTGHDFQKCLFEPVLKLDSQVATCFVAWVASPHSQYIG